MTQILLASSSPYRRQLLDKLGLSYACESPNINEAQHHNETAHELVQRLASEKAQALAENHPNTLIIGSDQVAVINQTIVTKPANHSEAKQQLQASSGQTITFLTGLCLYNTTNNNLQVTVEPFQVEFLHLTEHQIERYLTLEKPYDCAGSFKSEGLGISLFKRLIGNDPNTLIGLPLIKLCEMLRNEGVDPLLT